MALQSAPLGQLPSMNMPYAIPTYEKPPSLLEKALASIITAAGTSAASQGAENLMSRDYATAADGGPATGFGRLLGPKVGKAQEMQRQSQTFQGGQNEAQRKFEADQLAQKLLNEQGAADARAANERLLAGDVRQSRLDEQLLADKNAQARLDRELSGREADTRLRAQLEAQNPETQARAGLYQAQGKKYNLDARFLEDMMNSRKPGGATAPGGPQVSDADRAAMQKLRQGQTGAPASPDVPVSDFLGAMADTPVGKTLGIVSGVTPAVTSLQPVSDALTDPRTRAVLSDIMARMANFQTIPQF